MHTFLRAALVAAVALAVAGCASISVQPGTMYATPQAPHQVYVTDFSTKGADFRVDRDGAELKEFKSNLQTMMTTAISFDLTKRLIQTTPSARQANWPRENAWLIRGDFVRVNQGSRLLRGAVGFGFGGTKLVTNVRVYDLMRDSQHPFLTFTTTGGSNAEPGAVTAIATDPLTIAIEAVSGGAGGIAHGLTEDTKRTAREITAELSDYMYRSRWISEDKWIEPKKYGNW
jgi:hypothetical protein